MRWGHGHYVPIASALEHWREETHLLFRPKRPRQEANKLSGHKRYTVTALIEEWAASPERRATARPSGKALKTYYDG
jgi:hypothetical protein